MDWISTKIYVEKKKLQSVLPLKQVKAEGAQHRGVLQLGGVMAAWRGRHFVT